jgi:cytochrome b involved in lipid metabolism
MSDATTSEPPHPYTLETLKAHGTRDDLWLLIDGKVYDVTKFMDEVCHNLHRGCCEWAMADG